MSPLETGEIDYQTRPYVCGAIGAWTPDIIERLRLSAPQDLREVHRSDGIALYATGKLEEWRSNGDHGYIWGDLATASMTDSWRSAADGRMAAGVQISNEHSILHTDSLGFQDVYYRQIGRAVYFSVRIDALIRLTDALLSTDWHAWANTLAITTPLGIQTPFKEIRRMAAATAWSTCDSGVELVSFQPGWQNVEPTGGVEPAEAIQVIADRIPKSNRLGITLSGGWDSRLLAILGKRRADQLVAWTTSNDDGRDRDIEFAKSVAESLGLEHEVLVPGAEAWLDEQNIVRQRTGFQTTHHTWIMPLARQLHQRPERFLDGLAGDVLFKNLFVTNEIAKTSGKVERNRLLWNSLEIRRARQADLLAPGLAARFEEASRNSYLDSVRQFDDHPAAATLAVLHTRTARAIASSPLWLVGPETNVILPFVAPEVLATALRIPIGDKVGGTFYRQMLEAADLATASLPSTNDTRPVGARGARRQESPKALHAIANTILDCDTTYQLLSPQMRSAIKSPSGLQLVGSTTGGLKMLHWASLLAEWRATYRDVLSDDAIEL